MNRKLGILLMALITIILLSACSAEGAIDEVAENKTRVEIQKVITSDITEKLPGIGSFEAFTNLEIIARGSGEVEKLLVKAGDQVEKGQLLFTLDNESAQINYDSTESQLRTQRDNLKSQLEDLKIKYDQNKALYGAGSISKRELESIELQLSQTENQYKDSVNNYNNQRRNLSNLIDDRSFESPVDGRVAIVYIKENQTVNNSLALEIINDDQMLFKLMVTGKTLDQISIGTMADIYIDGDREQITKGQVFKYNEVSDPNSGLYEVYVLVNNKDGKIRSGSYAELDFIKDMRKGLVIPKKSVVREGEDHYVFVEKDSIAEKIKVEMGVSLGDFVEILSGLEEGMNVVSLGQNYLSDNENIIVVE